MALGRGRRSRKWGADAYFTFPPPALSFFIGTWMDRSFSSVSSSSVAYTGIKREEEEASLPHFSLAFERKDEGEGGGDARGAGWPGPTAAAWQTSSARNARSGLAAASASAKNRWPKVPSLPGATGAAAARCPGLCYETPRALTDGTARAPSTAGTRRRARRLGPTQGSAHTRALKTAAQ